MIAENKKTMRLRLRELRRTKQERDEESAAICRHILESVAYRKAAVIGGYSALQHEADITAVLRAAIADGKTVAMPLCDNPPHMTLRRIHSLKDLLPGRYGIPEPSSSAQKIEAGALDLLLVPLEGIDRDGFRLGKGGGYYDCLLEGIAAYSVGCALTWQIVNQVPREPWDKPLCACADMHGMREFGTDCRKDEKHE